MEATAPSLALSQSATSERERDVLTKRFPRDLQVVVLQPDATDRDYGITSAQMSEQDASAAGETIKRAGDADRQLAEYWQRGLDNIIVGILVAALAVWSAIATDAERRRWPHASYSGTRGTGEAYPTRGSAVGDRMVTTKSEGPDNEQRGVAATSHPRIQNTHRTRSYNCHDVLDNGVHHRRTGWKMTEQRPKIKGPSEHVD